jgi:hypothetical protein
MLTYAIHGHILTLTAVGISSPEHRAATFDALRMDANIPQGVLLLVDAHETTESLDAVVLRDRLAQLMEAFGPKLAPVCAVIGPPSYNLEAHLFQKIAGQAGLRVGLFKDEASARAWLSVYRPDAPAP